MEKEIHFRIIEFLVIYALLSANWENHGLSESLRIKLIEIKTIVSLETSKTIGERIRFYRMEQRCTQEDLSEKANLPQSTISRSERGESTPSAANLSKIARALNISVDKLLDSPTQGENPPEPRSERQALRVGLHASLFMAPVFLALRDLNAAGFEVTMRSSYDRPVFENPATLGCTDIPYHEARLLDALRNGDLDCVFAPRRSKESRTLSRYATLVYSRPICDLLLVRHSAGGEPGAIDLGIDMTRIRQNASRVSVLGLPGVETEELFALLPETLLDKISSVNTADELSETALEIYNKDKDCLVLSWEPWTSKVIDALIQRRNLTISRIDSEEARVPSGSSFDLVALHNPSSETCSRISNLLRQTHVRVGDINQNLFKQPMVNCIAGRGADLVAPTAKLFDINLRRTAAFFSKLPSQIQFYLGPCWLDLFRKE